jgi:hypothetical protein
LLKLTTTRRLAILLFVFLAWTPTAYAWSWPVQGPVVQPFAYDEAHPYAAGQHRGIDIGADAAGETVMAPAAGTVSFAGTVPTNGRSVTIETADGYSVTLTHLGSLAVAEGATVAEQAVVGTVGPSGTPEVDGPYVHLGIRVTADPNGYVDPLGLLPSQAASVATDSGSSTSRASSSAASAATPASKPASKAPQSPQVTTIRVSAHEHGRAQAPRAYSRPRRLSSRRPTVRHARPPLEAATPKSRPSERTSPLRRPDIEVASPRPAALDAGHDFRVSATKPRRAPSSPLAALMCNWAAALFALGAAFAAKRRRRRVSTSTTAGAEVLQLQRSAVRQRRVSRAA